MPVRPLSWLLLFTAFAGSVAAAEPAWRQLDYAPVPVENPLKGLVPYWDAPHPEAFPHSMEFSYFPMSAVVKGPEQYDWSAFEAWLDKVAGRGHQAVFRFFTEYPGKPSGVPQYLREHGLNFTRFTRESTPPRPPVLTEVPDYKNLEFRQAMVPFVKALGARYDGDARIGFITAGLLGLWGEWHDSPHRELFASKEVQAEIMDAYEAAFHVTPILLRYPAGPQDAFYVDTTGRRFGYHDDSFAWSTIGDKQWFFLNQLRAAGPAALDKWMTQPIGGEIRPEAMGWVFDQPQTHPKVENFRACVDATHATWMMDSGMFRGKNPPERQQRALAEVRHMGYEFCIRRVALEPQPAQLRLRYQLENTGVAPFYYAWPIELALLDDSGKIACSLRSKQTLMQLLPQKSEEREIVVPLEGLAPANYRLLLRAANPLPKGKAVCFANATQNQDLAGWLTLGRFSTSGNK